MACLVLVFLVCKLCLDNADYDGWVMPAVWRMVKRTTRLQANAHKYDNVWLVTTLYSYIYSLDCQGAVRDHSCVTSDQTYIENNTECITSGNHHTASSIECNREGVTGTGGYRHTASRSESLVIYNGTLMRIVQLSKDGRVSAVLPERSDDLDPPALE